MSSPTAKTFLITGAARGIGRGLSRLLVQRGHRVFLLDSDAVELEHTLTRLENISSPSASTSTSPSSSPPSIGRNHAFDGIRCDITDAAAVARAITAAKTFFSAADDTAERASVLDCVINNAAYTGGASGSTSIADDEFLEIWQRSIETNLTGAVNVVRACLPLLRQHRQQRQAAVSSSQDNAPPQDHASATAAAARSPSIIHISSTRARQAEPHNESYSATKAGLLGLSQALSVSLAEQRIRSNAILPGWIHVANECREADETHAQWTDGLSAEDHKWHSTGRVGRVEDVLEAVLFLASADGVTGAEVVVDGGVTRKMVYPE